MKRVGSWVVFACFLLTTWAFVGPTSLGGPASYVIVDGRSMEPTYHDGDLVIARHQATYAVGDVITYDAPTDADFPVIHRVIEVVDGGYRTQGDNRDEPDGWLAPEDAIHGATWVHLPYGGSVIAFLRQPTALMGLVAGWLTFGILGRREQRAAQRATAQPPTGASQPKVQEAARGDRPASSKRTTVALLSVAAVVGGTSGILVAHAAALSVDAGVLRTFQFATADLPEPPPPPSDAEELHQASLDETASAIATEASDEPATTDTDGDVLAEDEGRLGATDGPGTETPPTPSDDPSTTTDEDPDEEEPLDGEDEAIEEPDGPDGAP